MALANMVAKRDIKLIALALVALIAIGIGFRMYFSLGKIYWASGVATQFCALMLMPIILAIVQRRDVISAAAVTAVPAGITISVYRLFLMMYEAENPADISAALALLYAPLVLGLFLSYALRIVEPINPKELTPLRPWQVFLAVSTAICAPSALIWLDGQQPPWEFMNLYSGAFAFTIWFSCYAYNCREQLSAARVLARAGTLTCIASAAFGVVIYAHYIELGATEPRAVGPMLASIFLNMSYGSLMLVAAGMCGGLSGTDKEIRDRDWHLSEAYVFLTLIIFPPAGLSTIF